MNDGYYGVLERHADYLIVKCHACNGLGHTHRYGGDGEGTTRACVGCKGAGVHVLPTRDSQSDGETKLQRDKQSR